MVARFHVAVIGAGLVGSATAIALARCGLNVALIETREPSKPASGESWDARIYAINPGSEAFLQALGVWPLLDTDRVQPVYGMDVSGDAGGRLRMDAYASGEPHLASIVESGHMQKGLWQVAAQQDNVTLLCPAGVRHIEWGIPRSRLTLDTGACIEVELVVGADGAQSLTRERAGIAVRTRPYNQSGVVANFATEKPHHGVAHQWFRNVEGNGDVVAYLPLPGNRMSMVWSTATDHAQSLLALEPEEFCARVGLAGQSGLGKLSLLTPPAAFPLRLLQPETTLRPGCALVGDAAHGVHPLAGQGVNLGFGDALMLAEILAQRGRAGCGDERLLARYARRRAEPVARMQFVTDSLWRLFGLNYPLASWMRNSGMTVLNHLGPLKSALVHEALFT